MKLANSVSWIAGFLEEARLTVSAIVRSFRGHLRVSEMMRDAYRNSGDLICLTITSRDVILVVGIVIHGWRSTCWDVLVCGFTPPR